MNVRPRLPESQGKIGRDGDATERDMAAAVRRNDQHGLSRCSCRHIDRDRNAIARAHHDPAARRLWIGKREREFDPVSDESFACSEWRRSDACNVAKSLQQSGCNQARDHERDRES